MAALMYALLARVPEQNLEQAKVNVALVQELGSNRFVKGHL